jgi:hypothetical protein
MGTRSTRQGPYAENSEPAARWRDALLLVGGYLALDWLNHIHPHGLDVTPWNPPALGSLSGALRGQAAAPLALAILVADAWVRAVAPWLLACGLALQLTAAG